MHGDGQYKFVHVLMHGGHVQRREAWMRRARLDKDIRQWIAGNNRQVVGGKKKVGRSKGPEMWWALRRQGTSLRVI